jgi:poly(A) polymerase Pap1
MLELRQLSEAYVPVIKFLFDEIEVDLTFARLNRPVPREEKELLVSCYIKQRLWIRIRLDLLHKVRVADPDPFGSGAINICLIFMY